MRISFAAELLKEADAGRLGTRYQVGSVRAHLYVAPGGTRYVVIPGTDCRENWRVNLRVLPLQGPARCHRGFWDTARELAGAMRRQLNPQDNRIIGHSMGGGVALALASMVPHAEVTTFGAPRVFAAPDWAELREYVRVEHHRDPVTWIPLPPAQGRELKCGARGWPSIREHTLAGYLSSYPITEAA